MSRKCPKCGSENVTQINEGLEMVEQTIKDGVKVIGYTLAKNFGHPKIGKMLFDWNTSSTKKI